MADVATTFATLSTDAPNVWIARQTFRLAERNLRVGRYATMYNLVQRMGKTLRIIRHRRLALPTVELTEGVPPDAVALAVENVDVTVEQWGIVVLITDVAQITTRHPALNVAINRTSLAMAEVLEREIAETLLAGTNLVFPGAVASRAALLASSVLNTATVIKSTTSLRTAGAAEGEGGLFNGVMAPAQEGDVIGSDSTFQAASNFANVKALQFGEIGIWMGVRWSRGNFLPIFKGVPAPAGCATAERALAVDSGAGGARDLVQIVVVARDASSNFERKISQVFTAGGAADDTTITAPTSTNYRYDIYAGPDGGGAPDRLVFSGVAASSVNLVDVAAFAAGTVLSPPAAPADQVEVFIAWVFGLDSYGRVELDGMSLESFITPAGASFSNPLAQGRKVGSKIMWKSFIIDNSFFIRIETGSSFSAQLPA